MTVSVCGVEFYNLFFAKNKVTKMCAFNLNQNMGHCLFTLIYGIHCIIIHTENLIK